MKRKKFIQLSAAASVWLTAPLKNQLPQKNIKIQQILGLNQSHLKPQGNLEKNTYKAFLNLKQAAEESQINLQIASGYRSFYDQKRIFESKYRRYTAEGLSELDSIKKIITYSTIPGTSRHHWGTDFDLIDANVVPPEGDLLLEKNYHGNGPYCRLFEWMITNGPDFGFELVYTNNYYRKGFKYEPWHFSYKPIAQDNYKLQQSPDYIEEWKKLSFKGKEAITAQSLQGYFEEHLGNINPSLK